MVINMKNHGRTLTVISIIFIIFGFISAVFSVLEVIVAAYHLYMVGFWGGFITAITAVSKIIYAVLVVAGGITGLMRKRLNFCYKLGVLLVVFVILQIIMAVPKVMIGAPLFWFDYLQAALSLIAPILFVRGIVWEQKRLAAVSVVEDEVQPFEEKEQPAKHEQ